MRPDSNIRDLYHLQQEEAYNLQEEGDYHPREDEDHRMPENRLVQEEFTLTTRLVYLSLRLPINRLATKT